MASLVTSVGPSRFERTKSAESVQRHRNAAGDAEFARSLHAAQSAAKATLPEHSAVIQVDDSNGKIADFDERTKHRTKAEESSGINFFTANPNFSTNPSLLPTSVSPLNERDLHATTTVSDSVTRLNDAETFLDWLDTSSEHYSQKDWRFEIHDADNNRMEIRLTRQQDGNWDAELKTSASDAQVLGLARALAERGVEIRWSST